MRALNAEKVERLKKDIENLDKNLVTMMKIKKEMFRLIADEGKIITDGEYQGTVIDVIADKVGEWHEIDVPEQVDEEK